MASEPIIYNPDQPIAHYKRAGEKYKKVKKTLELGAALPALSLICGIVSIIDSPREMALFALFGITFTMLSIIGCTSRRSVLCLLSIPLGVVAGITALAANGFFSPVGALAHALAIIAECCAIPAINEFYKLKALPGFPLFNYSMDDISFAAKDHRGTAEFIDSENFNNDEKTVYRINPDDVIKYDEMDEVITGVSLKKEDVSEEPEFSDEMPSLEREEPKKEEESTYEKMIRIQPDNKGEISDVDLFEM